jgi:hypothetical protein
LGSRNGAHLFPDRRREEVAACAAASRIGPAQLEVTSSIEVSAKTESPVEIGNGVASSVIRKGDMSLKGPVQLGKPTILISGDASSRDKNGNAVVYVARIVLGAAK